MDRRCNFGLILMVVCLQRQANSFFTSPSFAKATSRPAFRTTAATLTTTFAAAKGDDSSVGEGGAAAPEPVPLSLDLAAPCAFIAKNNVNLDGDFISSKEGEPTAEELSNHNIIKILAQKGGDEEVNWILWKCLGYRYDPEKDAWNAVKCFPRWEDKYPEPVDLIGVTRTYSKEVDQPVLRAVQFLTRSIPGEYKRLIVEQLRPLGFTGLLPTELTPNRTRRAQMGNFLLYYREHLWGVPLEEVERRRVERHEKMAAAEAARMAEEAQKQRSSSAAE